MSDTRTTSLVFGLTLGLTGLAAVDGGALKDETPGQFFERRLPGAIINGGGDALRTFPNLPPNLFEVKGRFGEPWPDAVDLQRWREGRGAGDLPIRWDPEARRFVLLRQQALDTSDARLRFTWYFLRSYSALDPKLKESESTLAVGAAALVASEAVRKTNLDCLPIEFQDAAAIVNLLILYRPGLLDTCFRADAVARVRLVDESIRELCTAEVGKPPVMAPIHSNATWIEALPLGRATADGAMTLAEFLPPSPVSLERVAGRACADGSGIVNLVLRARVVAASGAGRFGLAGPTPGSKERASRWEKALDDLIGSVQKEMAQREIASVAKAAAREGIELLANDPSIVRPLMAMAGQASADRLREAAARGPDDYQRALLQDPNTARVISLAGSVPKIVLLPAAPGGARRVARLTWGNLLRTPAGGNDRLLFESVSVDLALNDPAGEGRRICGVGLGTLVITLGEDGRPVPLAIEKVQRHTKVRGYVDVGPPATSPGRLRLEVAPRPVWFTVSDVHTHESPMSLELAFANGASMVIGYGHRILFGLGEQEATWREAHHTDVGARPWRAEPTRIAGLRRLDSPDGQQRRTVKELSLVWDEKRGRATNLEVLTPDGKAGLIVEARSVEAGPIAAESPVRTADGGWKKAGEIVTVEEGPTVVYGYHLKPDDDPWTYPPLTRHESAAVGLEPVSTPSAIELRFKEGNVVLGPGNWLLVDDLGRPKEVPVGHIKPGMEVVRDVVGDKIETTTVLDRRDRPGAADGFVRLAVANLGWARVGPVLVSVDSLPLGESAIGVAGDARVILGTKTGTAGAVAKAERQRPPDLPATTSSALFFERVGNRLAVGELGATKTVMGTRTVVVEAAQGGRTEKLEVAPGQPLLVLSTTKEGKSLASTAARFLNPKTDMLYVADPGEQEPKVWPIRTITPKFYHRRALVLLQSAPRREAFYEPEGERDIAFAEGIGVLLGRDRSSSDNPEDTPGIDRGAGGGGDGTGQKEGKSNALLRLDGGDLLVIPRPEVVDKITIPPDALPTLRDRGRDLLARLEAEGKVVKLQAPGKDGTPLLNYWRGMFPRGTLSWPYESANILEELVASVRVVARRRELFLDNPDSFDLPPLLFQEMVTATWLRECGARESSDLLLLDLVELTIYAAAEPGRERIRFGPAIAPGLMLLAPTLIRGERVKQFPASLPAIRRLEVLVEQGYLDKETLARASVNLEDIYTAFLDKTQKIDRPQWLTVIVPPPRLNAEGEFVDELADSRRIWKDLDRWARAQARFLKGR